MQTIVLIRYSLRGKIRPSEFIEEIYIMSNNWRLPSLPDYGSCNLYFRKEKVWCVVPMVISNLRSYWTSVRPVLSRTNSAYWKIRLRNRTNWTIQTKGTNWLSVSSQKETLTMRWRYWLCRWDHLICCECAEDTEKYATADPSSHWAEDGILPPHDSTI